MLGNFNFDSKQMLNKTLIFNITIIDEEMIISKITDAINSPYNDECWIERKPGKNYFTLGLEGGR